MNDQLKKQVVDALERMVNKSNHWTADDFRHEAGHILPALSALSAEPVMTDERTVDEIVTGLYRRFKDWSKRGFGPDDVTWCEVKADVIALLSSQSASQITREGSVLTCQTCGHTAVMAKPESQPFDHINDVVEMVQPSAVAGAEPEGWKLAMRVLQSDLYRDLADDEKAACDALIQQNPCIATPSEAQAAPVDSDVGQLEYRGNSVAYIYQKMTAYRSSIDNVWSALRESGYQPDGNTSAADMVKRALSQQPAAPNDPPDDLIQAMALAHDQSPCHDLIGPMGDAYRALVAYFAAAPMLDSSKEAPDSKNWEPVEGMTGVCVASDEMLARIAARRAQEGGDK